MYATTLREIAARGLAVLAGLVLVTTPVAPALVVSASGTPSQTATAAASGEPSARLQVFLKDVTIHNDRDGTFRGAGELWLQFRVVACDSPAPPPCDDNLVYGAAKFGASTGDIVHLNRLSPAAGDQMRDDGPAATTNPTLGIPVRHGRQYALRISVHEIDAVELDDMGEVVHLIDLGDHGLGVGTHTMRSFKDEQYQWGDFTITYEIRRILLPDLRPVGISIADLPGSPKKRVCTAVQNVEPAAAGPFSVALQIDQLEAPDGRGRAGGLAAGESVEVCVDVALPATGEHSLSAIVGNEHTVPELKLANNQHTRQYLAAPATPPTTAARPDLTVAAIKVNGQVPDGTDDCKAGKNVVTVVVKNAGNADAGRFKVWLIPEDERSLIERSLSGLEAGREREVRFDDVRLRKGQHTPSAAVDAGEAVAESDEDNNHRRVTVTCGGAS